MCVCMYECRGNRSEVGMIDEERTRRMARSIDVLGDDDGGG